MENEKRDEFLNFAGDFDSAMLITHGGEDEILARPHVCITMASGANFVAITGVAEIVAEPDRVDQLWNEAWRVCFSGGPHDRRIALIHVHAREAEYWSNSGANRVKYLFDAATACLQGKRPQGANSVSHSHLEQ
jgi:general stress protein 26